MQPNIPLGARHNHTTLKIENNQIWRRPTSWSLLKLPVSGLYLKLFARGNTFLLAPSRTAGPIAGKPRDKVELLYLSFLPLFSFSSIPPVGPRWLSLESTFCHMSIPHWLLGLPLSPYPSTLDFSPIMCCHMPLMGPTWALCLTYPALDTWHYVNHSSRAKCPVLPLVPRKT